ncbi:MAG: Sulfide dehydrogenase (flavocytochrome c) flavoprotein chain precursor [Verrucomicrobia bacterium ADurb.Bin070]|nr:MAG: Sulfide dehydrogenase (flavocytochrome c) flavoprotein chain precursor [Verrucomicrobia bacterium ADurb.Bin070]
MTDLRITRRRFVQVSSAAAALALTGTGGCGMKGSDRAVKIVVIGGGAAGLGVSSRLVRLMKKAQITLIDPADRQFYQPGFTLIGSGVYRPDQVWRRQSDCIPHGVKWVKQAVTALEPAKNTVTVSGGAVYPYDFLVLTPGIQCNWEAVEGLSQKTLGEGNVHSIYDFEGAQKTWRAIQAFVEKGGRGVFADTYTKHKCGGAPKKICLLTEHLSRKRGTRDSLKFDYFTASKALYDVPFFTPRLEQIYKERSVSVTTHTRVKGVDTAAKKVHFLRTETVKKEVPDPQTGEMKTVEASVATPFAEDYDFLHLAPPQSAPDFVRQAGLGWTEGKLAADAWVMVDKQTLVHKTFANIVSLGDATGVPTSKTSAAARKQIPVAVRNLVSLVEGRAPEAVYDGYAACPIVTDYGHVLMAEFDYDKKPRISFPLSLFDMSTESRLAWLLKVYALKPLYFHGMIPGYW